MKIDRLVMFVFLCVSLTLSGCASTQPSREQMRTVANYQLPKPEAGKAMVYVFFPEDWSGLQFDVHLDGQGPQSAIGYNRGGQYLFFSVLPGEHRVYSREHGNTSAGRGWTDFAFTAKAGDILFLRQEMVMGWVDVNNRLAVLPPEEGKYYIKTLNAGTLFSADRQTAAPLPQAQPAQGEISAAGNTFVGRITGGNLAKGVGFSNLNVKLIVTADNGELMTFFVRSDSKVFDVSGNPVDYMEAFRMHKKRVEIQHFVIRDGTGGQPGRSDFAYEIGQKGVRTLRVLGE